MKNVLGRKVAGGKHESQNCRIGGKVENLDVDVHLWNTGSIITVTKNPIKSDLQ